RVRLRPARFEARRVADDVVGDGGRRRRVLIWDVRHGWAPIWSADFVLGFTSRWALDSQSLRDRSVACDDDVSKGCDFNLFATLRPCDDRGQRLMEVINKSSAEPDARVISYRE